MSRNSEKPTVSVNEFPGLATTDDAFETGHTGLTKALNVDITRKKKIKRRKGATKVSTIGAATALAASGGDNHLLFTESSNLLSSDENYSLTTLRSDMTPTDHLCSLAVGNNIIYSNGIQRGYIRNGTDRELGVTSPTSPATAVALFGFMAAGKYQIAYTYVRADGFESGTGVASIIDIAADEGGVSVSVIASTNPDVDGINIYCTRPNGTQLYFAMTTPNVTGNYTYNSHANFLKRALRTQFKYSPPAFDVIAMGRNNRVMYAKDNLIFVSDPYAPEHVDEELTTAFPDRVCMIGGIEGGVFVGTDKKTYFLKGDSMEKAELDIVAPYGAVLGTLTHIDGALLGDGSVSDILPVWMSHNGLCVGMPGGKVTNLTQVDVVIPKGLKGTTMFRQEGGQNHIISVIQK